LTSSVLKIKSRFQEFRANLNIQDFKSADFLLYFFGWFVTFFFLILSIERDFNWKITWILFFAFFWVKTNRYIITKFKPPVELIISLLLLFFFFDLILLKSVFSESHIDQQSSVSLGNITEIFHYFFQMFNILLFGLLLVLNSEGNQKFVLGFVNSDKNENPVIPKIKQSVLVNYVIIGFAAHLFIFFDHDYYLILLQFFIFLVLLKKTTWLEILNKTELWFYFLIFLFAYLLTDISFFSAIKGNVSDKDVFIFSIPLFIALLVKMYFLVIVVKIPIVLIYNHAQLSRKLEISGLFQSTFPQFIQLIFLIFIFYFFISGWQAENIRNVIYSELEKIKNGDNSSITAHRELSAGSDSTLIIVSGYNPEPFSETNPEYGLLRFTKADFIEPSHFGQNDYFLYVRDTGKGKSKIQLIKIDEQFLQNLNQHLPYLGGTGLILYPYEPTKLLRYFYDTDFLWQTDKIMRIFPFDLISNNNAWVLQSHTEESNTNEINITIMGQKNPLGEKEMIIGRMYMPVVNKISGNESYFAFDAYWHFQTSFFGSPMAKVLYALIILFFLFNIFVIRRVIKFGSQINKIIVQKFSQLKLGIRQMSSGNLDYKFNLEGEDEFVELAGRFNQMGEQLKKTINDAREKERLDHELKIARQVQIGLLPTNIPSVAGYNIAASMETAMEIGGDFYDVIKLSKNRFLFTIGDVSGKGSSAAFYMAQFISLLRYTHQFTDRPDEIAHRINNYFANQVADRQIFVTAIIGILDTSKDTIRYVRAGHTNPVFIPCNPEKDITEFNPEGIGIGLTKTLTTFKNALKVSSVKMQNGDCFIFYTDGLIEAARPIVLEGEESSEVYGEERMLLFLKKQRRRNADEIMKAFSEELKEFYGNHPRVDDHTLLIFQKKEN